ncbi:MAG: arginine deiminase family protein [Sphingomicrobium sp.]
MDLSEFSTEPARILIHDPRDGRAAAAMDRDRLAECNFLDLPGHIELGAEYARFREALEAHVEVTPLASLLADDAEFAAEADANPNLMFMRDSSITLPWAPNLYIPARFGLASRQREPAIAGRALERLGLTRAFDFTDDEYVEGGDVLAAMDERKRILLIGFGVRTSKAAALRLALELIPDHLDMIIGLSHDPDLLHLDTGFTVLPNRVMLAAAGMFHAGFLIDERRSLSSIDPIAHAESMGFTIVRCDKADAIAHERCNLLPLGRNRYLAFDMPAPLEAELERKAGITIECVSGREIAKATGGVHCLTRPVYR